LIYCYHTVELISAVQFESVKGCDVPSHKILTRTVNDFRIYSLGIWQQFEHHGEIFLQSFLFFLSVYDK